MKRYSLITMFAVLKMLLAGIGWEITLDADRSAVVTDNHGHKWLIAISPWV